MMKVLHEEITRIHQIMNLHEGKHGNLPYLKRRLSVDVASELFSNAISTASNLLRKKKHKWSEYDLEKFTNLVVSIMYDSFFNDFIVRGEEIPDELSFDETWNYLLQVFGDNIAERYYEIMNEPENQEEKNTQVN